MNNGRLDKKSVTLCKYGSSWYYIKDGKINKSTTLCKYGTKWYYVKNGKMDSTYTGYVNYNGSKYYVVKGVMQKKVK